MPGLLDRLGASVAEALADTWVDVGAAELPAGQVPLLDIQRAQQPLALVLAVETKAAAQVGQPRLGLGDRSVEQLADELGGHDHY